MGPNFRLKLEEIEVSVSCGSYRATTTEYRKLSCGKKLGREILTAFDRPSTLKVAKLFLGFSLNGLRSCVYMEQSCVCI